MPDLKEEMESAGVSDAVLNVLVTNPDIMRCAGIRFVEHLAQHLIKDTSNTENQNKNRDTNLIF